MDVLRDAAEELAGAAAQDLGRDVVTYKGRSPTWSSTRDIHRWVTEIVRTRATGRLAQPDDVQRPDDLIDWFRAGAADVIDVLSATSPTTPVWTFAGEPTVRFWRRRMALETTIHCWDAHRAFGDPQPIADAMAVVGVTEALEIYLEPRLRGAGGRRGSEVVGLRTADGAHAWTVRLHSYAIDLLGADHSADVWVEAALTDLWLFVMGRVRRDVLDVHGPVHGVDCLARGVALLSPPAR